MADKEQALAHKKKNLNNPYVPCVCACTKDATWLCGPCLLRMNYHSVTLCRYEPTNICVFARACVRQYLLC